MLLLIANSEFWCSGRDLNMVSTSSHAM